MNTYQIGDLVRHKYDGGVGIIIDQCERWSNITMGTADKQLVRWIESPRCEGKDYTYVKENLYYLCYLELIEPTDKN